MTVLLYFLLAAFLISFGLAMYVWRIIIEKLDTSHG